MRIISVLNSVHRNKQEDKETQKIVHIICIVQTQLNCKYLGIRSYLNVLCDTVCANNAFIYRYVNFVY